MTDTPEVRAASSHDGRGQARTSIRSAKLRVPALSPHYVRRARLLRLLDAAELAPLTVVCAPAGSGKTTLAAGWAAESSLPTAWVSLDATDKDVRQFWLTLATAIQALARSAGLAATRSLRAGAPVTAAVEQLIDDLDAEDRAAAVLLVDDLQLADQDESVAATVSLFAQHLPAWLHLVLLSRHEPALPRDRLRVRGQLEEIHFAELRFSVDEAKELMQRLDALMDADRAEQVAARAEGWATALHLAALVARSEQARRGIDTVRGADHALVEDYVLREALAAEGEQMVAALTDVSVVARVNPELARALTDRADAGELLARAQARGLFVTRINPEGWYEVHSLVRAALLANLESESPGRVAEQHARAARWFEQEGEVPLALEHWLNAGQPREALRLLFATEGDLYDSGQEATITRTIAAIPPSIAGSDLEAMTEYAYCHLLLDRRRFVELAEEANWVAQSVPTDGVARGRLKLVRSMAAVMTGAWAEGAALARQSMLDLGDESARDVLGRFGWNMVARGVALSERWVDSDPEVIEALAGLGGDPRRRLAFEGIRAVGEALAGWPINALRVAAGARQAASVANMTILRYEVATAEAIARREIGDRQRALEELRALADAPAETMLYCRMLALVELTRAHLDEGDLEGARVSFMSLEAVAEGEFTGPEGRDWLTRIAARLACASNDVDRAWALSDQIADPFWRAANLARAHLAVGNRGEAGTEAAAAVPRCTRHEVVRELLLARATTDRDEATQWAATAVAKAAAAGMLQTVAAEAADIPEVVERAAWQAPQSWLDRYRRLAGFGSTRPDGGSLIDPLTSRERDVLRFLAGRLTVREIADELDISVNTLKFHLKVIYRKLGVSTRSEAVEKARELAPEP